MQASSEGPVNMNTKWNLQSSFKYVRLLGQQDDYIIDRGAFPFPKPLVVFKFTKDCSTDGLNLRDGVYYVPKTANQVAFDAFTFTASTRTATVFQIAGAKQHDVKPDGIRWLKSRGVEKIRYVLVTEDQDVTISIAHELYSEIDPNVWQLALDPKDFNMPT